MKYLQSLQNAGAHLLSRIPCHNRVVPILHCLHWLPVQLQVIFKSTVLVEICRQCFSGIALQSNPQLRSVSVGCILLPSVQTLAARRVLPMAHTVWNSLPLALWTENFQRQTDSWEEHPWNDLFWSGLCKTLTLAINVRYLICLITSSLYHLSTVCLSHISLSHLPNWPVTLWQVFYLLIIGEIVVIIISSHLCLYVDVASGCASVYSIYSAGDGTVLQHDVGQMNRPAVNIGVVISITNSHVRSQVSLLRLKCYCFLWFEV